MPMNNKQFVLEERNVKGCFTPLDHAWCFVTAAEEQHFAMCVSVLFVEQVCSTDIFRNMRVAHRLSHVNIY